MVRLLTIVGARPQFVKAAVLSRAVAEEDGVQEDILHTGQHYDAAMSQRFFDELRLPQPKYNLGVGSGSHARQTGAMMVGIEEVLQQGNYDGVVVYGDTNSTLSGALAAAKLRVPVFHVEAGLRSRDMSMPEEQNRILTDHLSSICFAPTPTAMRNLQAEMSCDVHFAGGRGRLLVHSGDVMLDSLQYYLPRCVEQGQEVLQRYGLRQHQYVLCTLHRDFNTDSDIRLRGILQGLRLIAEEHPTADLLLPLHPRTSHAIERLHESDEYRWLHSSPQVRLLDPQSYLSMLCLESYACAVVTDSGGVQKEAFFLQKPCVLLRPTTEWCEIDAEGGSIAADADPGQIARSYSLIVARRLHPTTAFGDGNAARKILRSIIDYLT